MNDKIKVAILVSGGAIDNYQLKILNYILQHKGYYDPILLKLERPKYTLKHKIKKRMFSPIQFFNWVISRGLIAIIRTFEKRYLQKKGKSNLIAKRTLPEDLTIKQLSAKWSKNNISYTLDATSERYVKNLDLDLIIRFNQGIIRGSLLTIPKIGVMSLHHGDINSFRGGPSGFWEVLKRKRESGYTVQLLSEELDGGSVIATGCIQTQKTWYLNSIYLKEKSVISVLQKLDELACKKNLRKKSEPFFYTKNVLRISNNPGPLLVYIFKVIGMILLSHFAQRLAIINRKKWSIAISDNNNLNEAFLRYHSVPNLPGHFFADPFVYSKDGRNYCFVEDFNLAENRAAISLLEFKSGETKYLNTVIQEEHHLSFPFIFEDNDKLYMIPEASGSGKITLYECTQFPSKWEKTLDLMSDVSAADTMILKKNGIYFMLTNICSVNLGDHNTELHIFFSSDLITSDWKPLKQGNPLFIDAGRARNGGLLERDGKIYRIGQYHGIGNYGLGFKIFEVTDINPEKYEEKLVHQIVPSYWNRAKGIHHFSTNGILKAFDYSK